jgi:hypothetical protein
MLFFRGSANVEGSVYITLSLGHNLDVELEEPYHKNHSLSRKQPTDVVGNRGSMKQNASYSNSWRPAMIAARSSSFSPSITTIV